MASPSRRLWYESAPTEQDATKLDQRLTDPQGAPFGRELALCTKAAT